MALETCRKCGWQVPGTVKTRTCPNCGAKKRPTAKIVLCVVVALFIAAAIALPEDELNEEPAQRETKKEPTDEVSASPVISGITFEEVDSTFGLYSRFTDVQKEAAWKRYKGKCVSWVGELTHLDSGFLGGFKMGMRHLPATSTFDVLVHVPESEKEKMLSMQKGRRYPYLATLVSYGTILHISADYGCEK